MHIRVYAFVAFKANDKAVFPGDSMKYIYIYRSCFVECKDSSVITIMLKSSFRNKLWDVKGVA